MGRDAGLEVILPDTATEVQCSGNFLSSRSLSTVKQDYVSANELFENDLGAEEG
jgi:hypothetical protein